MNADHDSLHRATTSWILAERSCPGSASSGGAFRKCSFHSSMVNGPNPGTWTSGFGSVPSSFRHLARGSASELDAEEAPSLRSVLELDAEAVSSLHLPS